MRLTFFTRHRVVLFGSALVLLVTGCTSDHDRSQGAIPAPTVTPTVALAPGPDTDLTPTPGGTGTPSARRTSTPPPADGDARVTYGWGVPSAPVFVRHTVRVPVAPAPAPPLPYLTRVDVGDHPDERYSRITFAFRGAVPSYEIAYVPQVQAEGTGDPVDLPGNAFLRIRFEQAQAHDGDGRPTITAAPAPRIGYPTLLGYAFGGDFEGCVTYGLGLQAASDGDQALPVRALELTRPDGSKVVAIDVRYN